MPDVMDETVGDGTGTLMSLQLDPNQTNPILIHGSMCPEHPSLQTELSPRTIKLSVQVEFPSYLS